VQYHELRSERLASSRVQLRFAGALDRFHQSESGGGAYIYDNNGNLKTKTDARTTINYNYDALNRLISKTCQFARKFQVVSIEPGHTFVFQESNEIGWRVNIVNLSSPRKVKKLERAESKEV
jgi:YD repeat-containing protein